MSNDLYQANESLLQSYRQIFISFESFLLAVGAIVVNENKWFVCLIAAIGILSIWWLWYRIVRSRHLIVDFHKFNLSRFMPPENKSEDAYVHDKGLRKRVNQDFEDQDPQKRKIQNSFRGTRIKIDLIMPILITFVWVILAGYAFIK